MKMKKNKNGLNTAVQGGLAGFILYDLMVLIKKRQFLASSKRFKLLKIDILMLYQ
jgi:hypothetical protein